MFKIDNMGLEMIDKMEGMICVDSFFKCLRKQSIVTCTTKGYINGEECFKFLNTKNISMCAREDESRFALIDQKGKEYRVNLVEHEIELDVIKKEREFKEYLYNQQIAY